MTNPYRPVTELRAIELLEFDVFRQERICKSAMFGTIRDWTQINHQQFAVIFNGIERISDNGFEQNNETLGRIARIECFNYGERPEGNQQYEGMVLFTAGSDFTSPLVHFENALLGYEGSGPSLGRYILSQCGVPSELVSEAEASLGNRGYSLVFSREAVEDEDGTEIVQPYDPPVTEWRIVHEEKRRTPS